MNAPPRWCRALLSLACSREDRAFILSDLHEEFEDRAAREGTRRARRWYRRQVAMSLLPCLARRARSGLTDGLGGGPGDLATEARYAMRRLLRAPVQSLVTVASLGIGIGLTAAVFAVVNAFLIRPSGGLTDTEGLVALYTSANEADRYGPTSFPDFEAVAQETSMFEAVAASRPGIVRLTEGEVSERLLMEIVTGEYFRVLRARLPLGRSFRPEETVPGRAEQVAVISHALWEDRFGSDPGVLGRSLLLNGRDFTVIGVAPEGLLGRLLRLKVDVWVPAGLPGGIYHATPGELLDRTDREYQVTGRLREGVTLEQASARLAVLAGRLHEEHAEAWEDNLGRPRVLSVIPEAQSAIPPSGRAALKGLMAFLLAGAGFVLLIACVNVAGLFVARAARRTRELAVRLSLGASRGRIVRLLLAEALLVAAAGGAVGLWLASLAAAFLGAMPFPIEVPLNFAVGVDWRVTGFALGVALLGCLFFGLLPALGATRPDVVGALKGEASVGPGRKRLGLRGWLVVVQVAASVVLLVGSGLFLRSAMALHHMDSGLDVTGVALVSRTIREEGVGEADVRARVLELRDRIAAHPEVVEVHVASVAEASPFRDGAQARVEIHGYLPSEDESMVMAFNAVTPGYFEMLSMAPVRGRTFRSADVDGAPAVALVSQAFVQRYWPGVDPVGRSFTVTEKRTFDTPVSGTSRRTFEVVGVMPDVRVAPDEVAEPFFWTSYLQDATPLVVLHAKGRSAAEVVQVLRREVAEGDDDVQLVAPRTYADLMSFMALAQRLGSQALGAAGGFALLLALMGIYGIVSFAVSQRLRELAIRQAVGAARKDVLRTLVWDGMRLTGLGVLGGLVIAVPGALLLRGTLQGISPLDPPALLGSVAVLVTAALGATLVPARRALAVDAMTVLREE
ncbi:MAG: hypothetical protein AMXMBFR53_00620 [Gemmatimonadota bacterium]